MRAVPPARQWSPNGNSCPVGVMSSPVASIQPVPSSGNVSVCTDSGSSPVCRRTPLAPGGCVTSHGSGGRHGRGDHGRGDHRWGDHRWRDHWRGDHGWREAGTAAKAVLPGDERFRRSAAGAARWQEPRDERHIDQSQLVGPGTATDDRWHVVGGNRDEVEAERVHLVGGRQVVGQLGSAPVPLSFGRLSL